MPEWSITFHPEALAEAEQAGEWYRARSPAAARAFVEELDDACDAVTVDPNRWPPRSDGTRRFLFNRFPFALVYRIQPQTIEVIAVAHGKRRVRFWKSRLR